MKGYNLWSYAPYRPLLTEVGDIYICRIVPYIDKIHIEWLSAGCGEYTVSCRTRGEDMYIEVGATDKTCFDIIGLNADTDYEFFVSAGDKKSRIRLARCGEAVGTVVNYLHPDDMAYSFSGRYLCSPSIVRHPDGYLLASMDVYAAEYPQNLTLIFRSDDNGADWHYVSELMPCFWGKMFILNNELYMLGCATEYGDLLIGKSTDGGKTFSAPVTLLRGSNGKNRREGFHTNPQNSVIYNNRFYRAIEWGSWGNDVYSHAAMVMSCDIGADLLAPESWSFTEPKVFDPDECPEIGRKVATIEGTLVLAPDGKLVCVMRSHNERAVVYQVDTNNSENMLTYLKTIDFPAGYSKFMIKYDPVGKRFYTIASLVYDNEKVRARNLLVLMSSDDLDNWSMVCNLLDYRGKSHETVGFQYVDFEFENNDIIYLCRTAVNGAHNYHDSNYSTFHRIENFRML